MRGSGIILRHRLYENECMRTREYKGCGQGQNVWVKGNPLLFAGYEAVGRGL